MYIFSDESGDLKNWDVKSKDFQHVFVISGLLVNEKQKKKLYVAMQKLLIEISADMAPEIIDELKWRLLSQKHREKCLDVIGEICPNIYAIYLLKKDIIAKKGQWLMSKPLVFYNSIAKIWVRSFSGLLEGEDKFVFDKRTFGWNRIHFDATIRNGVTECNKKECYILHEDSKKDFCLQAADIIAGAIRNSYIHKNDLYTKHITHAVIKKYYTKSRKNE